jgi:replicative DNA helicase
MDKEQARQYLITCMDQYLAGKGLATDGSLFRCLSPDHEDKHPSMGYHNESYKVHCFGCGVTYDIFDLVGIDYHLDDYRLKFKKACEIFHVTVDAGDVPRGQHGSSVKQDDQNEKPFSFTGQNTETYSIPSTASLNTGTTDTAKADEVFQRNLEFIQNSSKYRGKAKEYLAKRHIATELADRFGIGFGKYYDKKSGQTLDVVVIPNGSCAVLRNVADACDVSDRYRKLNGSEIWNAEGFRSGKRLGMNVIVTEGEMDALSVLSSGGEAVALGSVSNRSKLVPVLKEMFGDAKDAPMLILALDNDDEGIKATQALSADLTAHHFNHSVMNLYGSCKDANEALMKYPDAFSKVILGTRTKETLELLTYCQGFSAASYSHRFKADVMQDAANDTFPTGFPILDSVIEGGLHAGLYAIGAIPSLGKTTFILQMADYLSDHGVNVLYFSLEMARKELFAKSVSRLTYLISLLKDNDYQLSDAKTTSGVLLGSKYSAYCKRELDLIDAAVARQGVVGRNLYIHEGIGDIGINYIADMVRKYIQLGHKLVVMIDYLQIMSPMDVRMNEKQMIDTNVLELKRLSRQYNIPVLVVSSFNRENYKGDVSFRAFKESGAIEYSSDVVLALQLKNLDSSDDVDVDKEKKRNPRNVELVVLKNRLCPTGDKIYYQYDARFNYFKEKCFSKDLKTIDDGAKADASSDTNGDVKPAKALVFGKSKQY